MIYTYYFSRARMAQVSIRIQGNQLGWRFLIMYNHGKLREEEKYRKRKSKEESLASNRHRRRRIQLLKYNC